MPARRFGIPATLILSLLPRGQVPAQAEFEAVLVKDINETVVRVGLTPGHLTVVGPRLFFVSPDAPGGGQTLWGTDGTVAGTTLLEEPVPFFGTLPANLADGGDGTLYFSRVDETGREMWKSDGTLAGTVKVKEINPGVNPLASSNPGGFTPAGGSVYFTADDGIHGRELWKTDGTEAGTVLVKDIAPGPDDGGVTSIFAVGDIVFFNRQTSRVPLHEELWLSDGGDAGTVFVKDFNPGGFADLEPITVFGGELYFRLNDTTARLKLWKSDGTNAGTMELSAGGANIVGREFTRVGDALVYLDDGDGDLRFELWKFDLTTGIAGQISPINWQGGGATYVGHFTDVGGTLYFTGDDGTTGYELWRHDFSTGDTVTVTDLNPDPTIGPSTIFFRELTDVDGSLFFTSGLGQLPYLHQIWTSDGTPAGTKSEVTINPDGGAHPQRLISFNDQLFFTASGQNFDPFTEEFPVELWRTDGTAAGTVEFRLGGESTLSSEAQTSNSFRASISRALVVGSTVYFIANDQKYDGDDDDPSPTNVELWKSDGTECGTMMVADIHPTFSSLPLELTNADGTVVFIANDGTYGRELWRYDPVTDITERLTDINPNGSSVFAPATLLYFDGALYFAASDGGASRLWLLDLATLQVEQRTDILTFAPEIVRIGTTLYFVGNDGTGSELWKHEITSGTTEQVIDINPNGNSNPGLLTVVEDTLFFRAYPDGFTPLVYRTDGTAAGTETIDVYPGGNSSPREFFAFDGSLYFQAIGAVAGDELWRHEVATGITSQITDLPLLPLFGGSRPVPLVTFKGKLFFRAAGAEGNALYAYDPATGGVELIADAAPLDLGNGLVEEAVVVGDTLFFTANFGAVPHLWMSDGTPGGAASVPFDNAQFIRGLVNVDGTLLFSAIGFGVGLELFRLGGSALCGGDAEAPSVSGVTATPNPVDAGAETVLSATGDDGASGGSTIVAASYSVDGGAAMAMDPADGAFDSAREDVTATLVFDGPGVYEVCVVVMDEALNTSDPQCIFVEVLEPDVEAPNVSGVLADPNPVAADAPVTVSATVDDSASGGSDIAEVLLTVDGGEPIAMEAGDGAFDSATEAAGAILEFQRAGVFELCVTAIDVAGNTSGAKCILLAVFDPDGGFVTGGGFIDSPPGACSLDENCLEATGKANFGFVSKYKKGATVPTGSTQFSFSAGGLNFHSDSYQWLVVAGARAKYKGIGKINGEEGYGFLLTVVDADLTPSTDVDRFRIKIWNVDNDEEVVYDNERGADESSDPTTAITGGQIVIHTASQ